MTEKREYDSQLGGDVVLDNHVPTFRYAASALREIRQLMADTQQPSATKLVFQTLPKHMRRRAMSHHPKRLPRKYRRIHISQMEKSGQQRISKCPSRKYRRRPHYLLQDYLRRQRRNIWLETHIWHARRFHMIDRWGYRLPNFSCDKTFRACYRATAEHCLVQDISYYVCFELQGTISCLFDGFRRISNKCQTVPGPLTLKARSYINGRREGFIDLFRDGQYPAGALCRASFMWRPTIANNDAVVKEDQIMRTLWLWVHPCVNKEVLSELIKVFKVQLLKVDQTEDLQNESANSPNLENIQGGEEVNKAEVETVDAIADLSHQIKISKAVDHVNGKIYKNIETGVTLIDLKDTMNRFRLTGPLSQSVLWHSFKTKSLPSSEVDAKEDWFKVLSDNKEQFQEQHNGQAAYWAKCKYVHSPGSLLSNLVLGLNIVDPRLQRPVKRTKALHSKPDSSTNFDELELLVNLPQSLSDSPIWDAEVRQEVRKNFMETSAWCQLREKHALVPGGPCIFEEQMQAVPVLLIQRPGLQDNGKRLNFGCGWDVIVPKGYGMPVWTTFIMWGAKPGGLREMDTLAREMGTELHLPDTVCGLQLTEQNYVEKRETYFKLPPGKRSNYIKLAINSPFRPLWSQLIRDWSKPESSNQESEPLNDTFFVLRDHTKLLHLHGAVRGEHSYPTIGSLVPPEHGIIQIRLRMRSRGNIGPNSLICLPTWSDIKAFLKRRRYQSNDPIHLEPFLLDLNQNERKSVRWEHKKQLKRLRRQRYREKKKLQETSNVRVKIRAAETQSLINAHFTRMAELWLPNENGETLYSVRKQCGRETVGYVTTADFSFTSATVCGVGYVASEGLKKLIGICQTQRIQPPMCFVRDVNSNHYYFATFDVPQDP